MPVVGVQLLKLYRKRKPAAMTRNTMKANPGRRSAYGATHRPTPRRSCSVPDTEITPRCRGVEIRRCRQRAPGRTSGLAPHRSLPLQDLIVASDPVLPDLREGRHVDRHDALEVLGHDQILPHGRVIDLDLAVRGAVPETLGHAGLGLDAERTIDEQLGELLRPGMPFGNDGTRRRRVDPFLDLEGGLDRVALALLLLPQVRVQE